jgi:predicted DNA-binding transcriptional regulator YafY
LQLATSPGVFGGPTVDATVLTTLAMACRAEERLRFDYAGRESAPAPRHVEPHRLVSLGRRWYLVAWDTERGDWRSFRVDRLTAPVLTGARFRPREIPGGDPAAWLQARLAALPQRYEVSVRIEAPAEAVIAYVAQWASVEALGPGSCRLRMGTDDLNWPVWILGGLGAGFTVESPPELGARVRATGEVLLRGTT